MTTNTPIHESGPDVNAKPKKRGFIWLLFFLIVAAVAGYAVYKAGQAGHIVQTSTGGGRGGSGGRGGRGALGPTPVKVSQKPARAVCRFTVRASERLRHIMWSP